MENLVGRQIRGFKYGIGADSFIGEIGIIVNQSQDIVKVEFDDANWHYPLDQIQPHLIPLEVFKLGQKVWDASVSEEAGFVVAIDNSISYPLICDFSCIRNYYKIDGVNKYGQKTLSSAPYTFQGFSQETIIEKGTLVYVKSSEDEWYIRFYDKLENGVHYCFNDQQKKGNSSFWKICQTENPLI